MDFAVTKQLGKFICVLLNIYPRLNKNSFVLVRCSLAVLVRIVSGNFGN